MSCFTRVEFSFAEDLPGRWQTFAEMQQIFQRQLDCCHRNEPSIFWNEGDRSIWSDFHARAA